MLFPALFAATALSGPYVCEQAAEKGWRYEDGAFFRPGAFNNVHRYQVDFRTLLYLERLLEALEARGVQLAIVLVPERMSAHPAVASRIGEGWERMDWDRSLAEYHAVRSWFIERGAVVPDLAGLALEMVDEDPSYFFRTDHHWTLEGSRRSAQAVGDAVRRGGGAPYLDQQRFVSTLVQVEEDFRGGLSKAAGKGCEVEVPQESKSTYETRLVDPPTVGLFDEAPPSAVVLASSSFGSPLFNFAGFLSEALGTQVLNITTDAGRTLSSLQLYLLSDEFQSSPAELVVWEVLVHHIYNRDDREVPAFQSAELYRQVLPGMHGPCSGDALLYEAEVRLEGGIQQLLTGSDPTWIGTNTYLHLRGSVLASTAIDLQLAYDGGLLDSLTLKPNPRLPLTEHRYLELRGDFKAMLREVRIVTPEGTTGTVEVQVCRVPS